MSPRSAADPDREAVYLAEHRLEQALAAIGPEGGPVVMGGRTHLLESELIFTTLAAAQGFATLTCIELGEPPVVVAHAAGQTTSAYRPPHHNTAGRITLAHWGGTRLTLCHELAHHRVRHRHLDHGPAFRQALCELLDHVGAPGQAQWLRTAYRDLDHARPGGS